MSSDIQLHKEWELFSHRGSLAETAESKLTRQSTRLIQAIHPSGILLSLAQLTTNSRSLATLWLIRPLLANEKAKLQQSSRCAPPITSHSHHTSWNAALQRLRAYWTLNCHPLAIGLGHQDCVNTRWNQWFDSFWKDFTSADKFHFMYAGRGNCTWLLLWEMRAEKQYRDHIEKLLWLRHLCLIRI